MTRITLTDEIRAELHRLQDETGVGASRLLRGRPIKLQKLNSSTVHQWMSGNVLTAGKEELAYVLSAWKTVSKIIPLTQEMYDLLSAEQDRTGVGITTFMKLFANKIPENFTVGILQGISRKARKTVVESYWQYITSAYNDLPTKKITEKKAYLGSNSNYYTPSRHLENYIKLTAKHIEKLKAEKERTGISDTALVKQVSVPLTPYTLRFWRNSRAKTADMIALEQVFEVYKALPSKS